jgi:hypothetical protein
MGRFGPVHRIALADVVLRRPVGTGLPDQSGETILRVISLRFNGSVASRLRTGKPPFSDTKAEPAVVARCAEMPFPISASLRFRTSLYVRNANYLNFEVAWGWVYIG